MAKKATTPSKQESSFYTIEDAMKITDDVFSLSKEKKYHPGAFVHGLIFALEYAQLTFDIPQQQLATIKRDCRRYIKEIGQLQQSQGSK